MNRLTALRTVTVTVPLLVAAAACGGDGGAEAVEVRSDRCIVWLHGKGGSGSAPTLDDDGIAVLSPEGNGTGWGGRQWEYDTDSAIESARDIISSALDEATCERVVVHGFSNGASMAAALLCSGDRLDDRLVGVIVDDPVTDAATENCAAATMPVAIYWTGALDETAPPGTRCDSLDWTCDGDVVRGIEAYASDIGVAVRPSPFDEHRWYTDTPLTLTWLG